MQRGGRGSGTRVARAEGTRASTRRHSHQAPASWETRRPMWRSSVRPARAVSRRFCTSCLGSSRRRVSVQDAAVEHAGCAGTDADRPGPRAVERAGRQDRALGPRRLRSGAEPAASAGNGGCACARRDRRCAAHGWGTRVLGAVGRGTGQRPCLHRPCRMVTDLAARARGAARGRGRAPCTPAVCAGYIRDWPSVVGDHRSPSCVQSVRC